MEEGQNKNLINEKLRKNCCMGYDNLQKYKVFYEKLEKIFKERIKKMQCQKDYYIIEIEKWTCNRKIMNSSKMH